MLILRVRACGFGSGFWIAENMVLVPVLMMGFVAIFWCLKSGFRGCFGAIFGKIFSKHFVDFAVSV